MTDDEALWCPSPESWTVLRGKDVRWCADWTEPEPRPAPPASIAWTQWHVIWWWSTVLDRSFGDGQPGRQEVTWPGAAEARAAIDELRRSWIERLDSLSESDFSEVH
ncbi:MAG: DinB family protein [Actinomycetia bacterium]|nr:DinB family protein [Actinomycetes bacterium]